jgi:hypothetical protein
MEIGKGKTELLQKKVKAGYKFQLTKNDIMWLIFYAWPKSFGWPETHKKATCDRGWNPLNHACLNDDEIQNAHIRVDGRGESAYHKLQQTGSELTSLSDLNTTIGISGENFCKLLHQEVTQQREEATYLLIIHQRWCEIVKAQLSEGTRCTDGVYVCAEGHHVSGNALEIVIIAKEKKEQKILATMEKKKT